MQIFPLWRRRIFLRAKVQLQRGGFPTIGKEQKQKKKPVKRGKRKSKSSNNVNSSTEKSMYIMGANSAGLFNKKESFQRYLNLFLPGVFFIQESKLRRKNKIKHPNYVMFEYVRQNCGGGGLYLLSVLVMILMKKL